MRVECNGTSELGLAYQPPRICVNKDTNNIKTWVTSEIMRDTFYTDFNPRGSQGVASVDDHFITPGSIEGPNKGNRPFKHSSLMFTVLEV